MKFSQLIPGGECIAAIGGGGKTGLLERLEGELRAEGRAALVSVTTRLARNQFPGLTRIEAGTPGQALEAAERALGGERLLMTGPDAPGDLEDNKYNGVAPAFFAPPRPGLTLLVEADGSRGLPLKAHRKGEPVLPALPCFVLAVLGLTALILPAAEAVHRPEILAAHLGPVNPELPLSPGQIAAFVKSAWGPLKPSLIFLNQLDALTGPAERAGAEELAERLRRYGFESRLGSLHENTIDNKHQKVYNIIE